MAKNIKNYSNYELFDFLLDPDFKKWVLNPDSETNAYWKQVLTSYPHQADVIEKATKIVNNLPEVNPEATAHRALKLWDKIDEEINLESHAPLVKTHKLKTHLWPYGKYAAVLLTAIGVAFTILTIQKASKITVSTGNGENKAITLPDGSILQLAPNSSVVYRKNITEQTQREVWATGEVNFNVKHLNQNPNQVKKGERFVVHLNHAIDVKVLGTVFNISDRSGKASVHLLSGSVKITRADQEILLKPGQSAVSNSATQVLNLDQSVPKVTHEWENHILTLNKTKISTIIAMMKDSYGVTLSVTDKNILNKEIDGAIPLDDFEKAMKILSSVTGGKVLKTSDHNSIDPH